MKKKILHVVGGMDIGGTETMLMNLYRQMHESMQFDFISYYSREGYYDSEINKLGGKVIRINPKRLKGISRIIKLYKVMNQGDYEVVHAHTSLNCGIVIILAKLARIKIRVSHSHTNLNLGKKNKLYNYIMRKLITSMSTNLVACSNSAGEYLFGKGNSFEVLPNYIDYNKIIKCNDTSSIRNEFDINANDILVGHIGRFVDSKNQKFLIDVLNEMIKKNEKIKAILVGDGPLKNDIQRYVKQLGIEKNINLIGLRNDVEIILNNCDLFIFPSIYEGLGLVILEAQAAGLPCLVSEAIQPEADLDIGLIKKLNLDNSCEEWALEASNLIGKKNFYIRDIEKAFKDKGLNLRAIIDTLRGIYNL